MTQSQPPDISQLIQSAQGSGDLSLASAHILQVPDVGRQIEEALGIPALEVTTSEVVLVAMLIDDSGSIRFAGNAQAVRDGHNLVLDALLETKQKEGILAHTRYLNGQVLFPFLTLEQAIRMDQHNYDPNGGTPLYDKTVILLGTVVAKAQEFEDNGVGVRTVTLIVTDGNDQHSERQTPNDVAKLVKDMLGTEKHIIAAMGVDDGSTDFREVFREIGIPGEWILTPGNTPHEIRQAFHTFSRSSVRASQSTQSFSQTAAGGFGAP